MRAAEPLGQVEFSVLDAVHRGALRSRRTARQIHSVLERLAGEVLLHGALRWCERAGPLSSTRDGAGRLYRPTAAGLGATARGSPLTGGDDAPVGAQVSGKAMSSELPSTRRKRP